MRNHFTNALALALVAACLAGCPLGRGNKQLGEACKDNNECAGANCGSGMCTARCKTDADCASSKAKLTCAHTPASPNNPENYGDCALAGPK